MYLSPKVLMLNNQAYALIETSKLVTNVSYLPEFTEWIQTKTRIWFTKYEKFSLDDW